MEYISILLVTLFVIKSANAESITVTGTSSSTCKIYTLYSGEYLNIHYNGALFSGECEIEVSSYGSKHLCVSAESMIISNDCSVEVKYYKGSSWPVYPTRTYDCIEDSHYSGTKWCPGESRITIKISNEGHSSTGGYNIYLKVTQTDDADLDEISNLASTVLTTTYIVIISVVAAVVVITVIVVIVVCCVCNRRRATRGTVFQNAQPVPNQVPIGTYPTTTTTPYPQAGVYPQTGYQPPPPNAGYQPVQNMEYKSESAPPVGPVQPPPYTAT